MSAIPLHLLHFTKQKQEQLPDLVQLFQTIEEPYEEYFDPEILQKGARQLASHTFCCYVLLKPNLRLLDFPEPYPSVFVPPWATRAIQADAALAYLEEKAEWLTIEIQLAVKGILGWGLLKKPTVAASQLIMQWYMERLYEGLRLLNDSVTPSEDDCANVKEVFALGENVLAAGMHQRT